jgi:hypothetical protein
VSPSLHRAAKSGAEFSSRITYPAIRPQCGGRRTAYFCKAARKTVPAHYSEQYTRILIGSEVGTMAPAFDSARPCWHGWPACRHPRQWRPLLQVPGGSSANRM